MAKELTPEDILGHVENWKMTLENRKVTAETILDSIERLLTYDETTEAEQGTCEAVVVTVNRPTHNQQETYKGADGWTAHPDGLLTIKKDDEIVGTHAAGSWSYVKLVAA